MIQVGKYMYGFSKKLIPALVCQYDAGNLEIKEIVKESDTLLFIGSLTCKKCSRVYHIQDGILSVLANQVKPDSIFLNEIKARDKGAHRYDSRLAARYYKEVISTVKALGTIKEKKLIDYGCGTGRITSILNSSESVLAVDFSRESLLVLASKLSGYDNFGLVWADATQFITKDNFFDLALSSQVLEHVPTLEKRGRWLEYINSTLKTNGRFVCTAYHHDTRRRFYKQLIEGYHPNSNIFFHYFSKSEIKQEFRKYFNIKKIKVIDITLPFEVKLGLDKKFKGKISRFLENVPIINSLGHLILVIGVKKINMKDSKKTVYSYGFILPFIFRKKWVWFQDPYDIFKCSMVNFFSYNKVDIPGFKRKEGITSVIDLSKSTDEIWNNIRKKFTRSLIEKGIKQGIVIKQDDNFSDFKKIYKSFRSRKKLSKDSFKLLKQGILFSAYYNEKMIAGHIFVMNNDYMRSWVAASSRLDQYTGKDRRLVGLANRMLIWEALKFAKNNNLKIFDLGGLDLNNTSADLLSLNEFKESFGGERRDCYYYSKVYSPFLKFLIKLMN